MNTNTGRVYPSMAEAMADLGPTETIADVIEVHGTREQLENLSRLVQKALAAERRQAADRAVDAARGPYGEGIDIDKLVEALEAEGWRYGR